jgi:hypothetical protein
MIIAFVAVAVVRQGGDQYQPQAAGSQLFDSKGHAAGIIPLGEDEHGFHAATSGDEFQGWHQEISGPPSRVARAGAAPG